MRARGVVAVAAVLSVAVAGDVLALDRGSPALARFPASANLDRPSEPFYIDLVGMDLRASPPTRDPRTPGYPPARELADGALAPSDRGGNFILGPSHAPAAEARERPGVAKGRLVSFTLASADSVIYRPGVVRAEASSHAALATAPTMPGDPSNLVVASSRPGSWTRKVTVYVPPGYTAGVKAPVMVVGDGEAAFPDGRPLSTILDNLIAARRIPPVVAVLIGSGGQDQQGSERGREYDTVSGAYAQWVETEVLPKAEQEAKVSLTHDPDGRATMGFSSSGAAAFTMAWFRPDLYRRVLAYSPTFVNQQWPHDPALPGGAWEYHSAWTGPKSPTLAARGFAQPVTSDAPTGSPLILEADRKPIRFWFLAGDRDMFYPSPQMADGMHDWVLANERMASVLAAKQYDYQFVFARNADHVDLPTLLQTLPEALEWLWRGYRAP